MLLLFTEGNKKNVAGGGSDDWVSLITLEKCFLFKGPLRYVSLVSFLRHHESLNTLKLVEDEYKVERV